MEFLSFFFDQGVTVKVVIFILVQVLVFLILSKSSNIFTPNSSLRSMSFKTMGSGSLRRILSAISDVPGGGETYTESPKLANGADGAKSKLH